MLSLVLRREWYGSCCVLPGRGGFWDPVASGISVCNVFLGIGYVIKESRRSIEGKKGNRVFHKDLLVLLGMRTKSKRRPQQVFCF